jgi:hypothetical protein
MRYTKTQSLYLSRKGVLPEIVDLFGMSEDSHLNSEEKTEINEQEDDDTTVSSESEVFKEPQITPSIMENDADDDIDSFFG